eukprot:gene15996-21707_t
MPDLTAADMDAAVRTIAGSARSMGIMVVSFLEQALALLAHLQGFEEQRLGRVHDLDVVLVRARGRDHVDHLFHRVHVGVAHITFRVGRRMGGLEHAACRGLVFLDAADLHAGRRRGVHQHGFKSDLARLVGLAVGAGHGVGVGQVTGHHVEPLRLRADGAARHVEDVQHAHDCPLIASSIVRTLPLMKRSVASYLTALSAKLARSRSMSTVLLSRLVWLLAPAIGAYLCQLISGKTLDQALMNLFAPERFSS